MCTHCDARAIVHDAAVSMFESPDLGERLEARGVPVDRIGDVIGEIESILADLAHWADGTYSLVPTWEALAGGIDDKFLEASASIRHCCHRQIESRGTVVVVEVPNVVRVVGAGGE